MSRGALAMLVLAGALAVAPVAIAAAQEPAVGELVAAPPSGPEPLWVPDPRVPAPELAQVVTDVVVVEVPASAISAPGPTDAASASIAHWMADGARAAGIPGELPVMAALTESGLRNLPYGDRDSVGFFQMRLGTWNHGPYEGYLARPELQLRWFVDRALAVRDARVAAGDGAYGGDPATWGDWIAAIEAPDARYRGRYQTQLAAAQALLAIAAPALAPFELGPTLAAPAAVSGTADELAQRVLSDVRITLDPRAQGDLVAGRVDPRVSAVLLAAAERFPIAIWVLQTGHSYLTVNGTVSNHSFGRAVDIGSVGGEVVSPSNAAARELALALGALDPAIRPTEIGTPWEIDAPGYFTDGDHRDHLHVAFDDVPASVSPAAKEPAVAAVAAAVKTPPAPGTERAEPRFDAGDANRERERESSGEPRFEVAP